MKFTPVNVLLKNNEEVQIRMAIEEDAAALTESVSCNLSDSNYIPLTPEEFNPSPEEEMAWIRSFAEKDNSLLLIAEKDGMILGNIDITGSVRIRMQHTGVIGMGIRNEYRNCGLGTALMEQAINWARNHPKLEILWLQVYEGNMAGMRLYQKSGFTVSGRQEKFFRDAKGDYDNNITMTLHL